MTFGKDVERPYIKISLTTYGGVSAASRDSMSGSGACLALRHQKRDKYMSVIYI